MIDSDTINVYWCPANIDTENKWDILYSNPQTLFDELNSIKDAKGKESFLSCPAVRQYYKNIYVFKNTIDSKYSYDFSENKKTVLPKSKYFLSYNQLRPNSIIDKPLVQFSYTVALFADQPLIANFVPPFFHEPKYSVHGSVVPGRFDIGKWFRPYNVEIQFWKKTGELHLENDEPLFYVHLETDKKIKMHRFTMSDKLHKHMMTNINAKQWYDTKMLLNTYYSLFSKSKMKTLVLQEIKQNILEQQ